MSGVENIMLVNKLLRMMDKILGNWRWKTRKRVFINIVSFCLDLFVLLGEHFVLHNFMLYIDINKNIGNIFNSAKLTPLSFINMHKLIAQTCVYLDVLICPTTAIFASTLSPTVLLVEALMKMHFLKHNRQPICIFPFINNHFFQHLTCPATLQDAEIIATQGFKYSKIQ
ncbi:hypothetical protein ACJX0J_018684 [Zea mays]